MYDEASDTISPALAIQNYEPLNAKAKEAKEWKPRQAGKGMTEEVIRAKTPIFLRTRKEHEEWFEKSGRELYFEQVDSSTILVPMMIREKVIGAIGLRHPTQEYVYSKDDLEILQALAGQGAIALENIRLYNSLKEAKKLQSALFRISEAAHTSENLEKLFPVIHDIVRELMAAKNFYIARYDSEAGMLNFPYYVNENTHEKPLPQKLDAGLTTYVLRTGEPLLVSPEKFKELSKGNEIKLCGGKAVYWLGIPLKTHKKTIGVLAVQSYTEKVRYGDTQQNILMFVSTQIATALERVHAHNQIEKSTEELKESEQRLSDIINFLPDATFVIDKEGKVIVWNHASEVMMGVKSKDILGKGNYEYALPLYGKRRRILIDLVLKRDEKFEKEHYDQLEIQGDTLAAENYLPYLKIYIYGKASPLYDPKHNIVGAILTIRDITDRKRAKERLMKLNQLGKKLTDSIKLTENQILQLVYDNASEIMDTSNMYIELYNEMSDETRFPLVFRDGKPIHFATRKAKNGDMEELIKMKVPILHSTKAQTGYKNSFSDEKGLPWIGVLMNKGEKVLGIIASYNVEKVDAYSKDDFEILQSMVDLAAIALENARLYSERAKRTEELEEKTKALEAATHRIAETQDFLTRSMIAADFVHKLNNLAGTIPIWINLIHDNTVETTDEIQRNVKDLLLLAEEVQEGQEGMDQKQPVVITTDFVQRLKNLAGTIPVWTSLLREETKSKINEIQNDVNYLLREVERLRTPLREVNINMNLMLETLLSQVRIQYHKDIQAGRFYIMGEVSSPLYKVWGLPVPIADALLNVISNGIESILSAEESGALTVKAKNFVDSINLGWVKIEITDTGKGIPEKYLSKLFSAFFSTKAAGRGYGLWRSKHVIENIGGKIYADSIIGVRTTFTILLPGTSKED